jgi:hypothetical protein
MLKTPKKAKLKTKTKTLPQNSKLLKNAFYSKKKINFLIFIQNKKNKLIDNIHN